ncbi:MAG: PQQ-binding-like beta-propeller repeat protein [Planctomycetes bacterium]|nr:PQQ-binding-like beta-propeller repeat protein [Planctomycetota bacterium]MBL7038839.1 PQQ-binding-like beta-propeller repeat protein [Pirellulaceae bacterium]
MKKPFRLIHALCVVFLLSAMASSADWPTYLANNERTSSTSQQLKLPLTQAWLFSSPSAPRRTWSGPAGRVIEGKELGDRVKFDDALHVAVVGDRVYFGSSVDHQVHCVNLQDGKEAWRFFTGAPVRLAPTVVGGRVYIGSDDGYAYCLDAENGSLRWKLRLGPADESIIARGEMISRWPVRTGVLVDGDTAYFGAGIFPHENVYLCAAKADDGTVLWKNDWVSHQDAGRNEFSPQGYLLATEDVLFVPSSRSRHKAVKRETGKVSGGGSTSLTFANTPIAGTDALIADGRLHTFSLETRLAVAGEFSCAVTGKEIIGMNRNEFYPANNERRRISSELRNLYRQLPRAGDGADKIKSKIAELQARVKEIADVGVVWRKPCTAEAAVAIAGDLVFAGDKGRVTAFETATGKDVWTAEVDGLARGLAVAAGNLFVSTTTGMIYCFADASSVRPAIAPESTTVNPYASDQWTAVYQRAAEEILEHSGVTRGFCLVVGGERGRLAYELARRSELKIYAVEPDEEKVEESREALSVAGLYGHRVTVHQADLAAIPYSNYFANLIVSDSSLLTGKIPGDPEKLVRHLKPAGGVIALGRPANAPGSAMPSEEVKTWLAKMQLADRGDIKTSGTWVTLTRGTLPGAGNWSHQYAEPGNTANSGDKLVKGGLGVLWYGDPGPDKMVNRHMGAVGPLVVDGRMFVQGENSLMAYDAYNGQFLWEVKNPEAIRTGVFQARNPGNLAAGENSLFHMSRDKVYEHDFATGEVKRIHELPASVDHDTHEWGYVAYRDGLLFGTATTRAEVVELNRRGRGNPGDAATDSIFAIDAKTGEHRWVHQGKSINFQTIALGPERVFFIDSSVTSEQRAAILRQDKSELKYLKGEELARAERRMKTLDVRLAVALDAKTGEEIWSEPVDVTDCSEIGIGGGKLTMMYHDDVLILGGANANGHYWKQFVAGEFSRRRLVALYALDGYKMWAKDANYRHQPIIVGDRVIAEPWAYDLKSGEQKTRVHPLTGEDVAWSVMRPGHHCGMLSACEDMLLFRSGYTAFFDMAADTGTRHFAGHRLGCWINAIPTNGLVVIPEASAGCVCMFSIASTIVMEPREPRRPWSLYSGVGATTPVKQMSLNLGAPGDRRDENGKLWLAYPRPTPNPNLETSLDLKLQFDTTILPGGGFFTNDGDASESSSSELTWIVSSGARGATRWSIPLRGKDDQPATYTVRLIFSNADGDKPGQRVFDVRIQGQLACENLDVAAEAGTEAKFVLREMEDILVSNNLVIDVIEKKKDPTQTQMSILSGIEVERSGS